MLEKWTGKQRGEENEDKEDREADDDDVTKSMRRGWGWYGCWNN
jgi:hypothetical protein